MDEQYHREHLVKILQNAYSGELAAAYAYRGHWKSLEDAAEINRIKQIEDEEWLHREKVGRLLLALAGEALEEKGSADVADRPHGGRRLPSDRAGFCLCISPGGSKPQTSESMNRRPATPAELGLIEFESELRVMAAVEREHEIFFMSVVAGHRLLPFARAIFKWGPVESPKRKRSRV